MEFKNSRTAQNLLKAFAGESQARNRYTFAASIARKEGLQYIANIFDETAKNEKEHASLFYKHLSVLAPSSLEITASYPIVFGDTISQLTAACKGENEEWTMLYPEFSRIAKEESFNDIARTFDFISKIEKTHEIQFHNLLEHLLNNTTFSRNEDIHWRCLECGHIKDGATAPKICPVCLHPQGFFTPIYNKL